jgi:hypothetical protein
MKYLIVVAVLGIFYMIYTGNMGGAKSKMKDGYANIKKGKKGAKPNILNQLLEKNKKEGKKGIF